MEALIKTAVLKGAEKFRIILKKEQFESIYQFCLGKVFVSLPTGRYIQCYPSSLTTSEVGPLSMVQSMLL